MLLFERNKEEIADKTRTLQELNQTLIVQKEKKETLIEENRAVQKALAKELDQQQRLVQSLRKKGRKYNRQIAQKQKQAEKIDKEINRLIREAIAASNKKAGKKGKPLLPSPQKTVYWQQTLKVIKAVCRGP